MADRAPLESPPAEPQRLQRAAGDPDRGEQVALAAAHDHIPAQAAGPDPERGRLQQDDASGDDRRPPKPSVALAVVTPAHDADRTPGRTGPARYDWHVNPVAALTRKGATPG